jgi:hypothetical protein
MSARPRTEPPRRSPAARELLLHFCEAVQPARETVVRRAAQHFPQRRLVQQTPQPAPAAFAVVNLVAAAVAAAIVAGGPCCLAAAAVAGVSQKEVHVIDPQAPEAGVSLQVRLDFVRADVARVCRVEPAQHVGRH